MQFLLTFWREKCRLPFSTVKLPETLLIYVLLWGISFLPVVFLIWLKIRNCSFRIKLFWKGLKRWMTISTHWPSLQTNVDGISRKSLIKYLPLTGKGLSCGGAQTWSRWCFGHGHRWTVGRDDWPGSGRCCVSLLILLWPLWPHEVCSSTMQNNPEPEDLTSLYHYKVIIDTKRQPIRAETVFLLSTRWRHIPTFDFIFLKCTFKKKHFYSSYFCFIFFINCPIACWSSFNQHFISCRLLWI